VGLLKNNTIEYKKLLLKIEKLKQKVTSLEILDQENKKTIKNLLYTKKMFQQITENTNDNIAIATFDLKATYLYVNPSVKQTLGYLPEEMVGKSFFNFVHPDDNSVLLSILKKYISRKIRYIILKSGDPVTESIRYRFKAKNGNWHHLESTVNIIGKDLLAVTRDLNARETIKIALEDSEQHYKQLFNSLPYGGEIFDLKGFIVECSKGTVKMLGYTREELLGKHITQFVDEDTKESFRINFPKVLKGESLFLESTLIHKNGTPVKVIRAGEPIIDSNGNISGILALSMDITPLDKAKKEITKYKDHLEEIVSDRTKEIKGKNKELERFNKLFVDREFRIKELRDKIKLLESLK
jgi:PAS domain S-box-containing protein